MDTGFFCHVSLDTEVDSIALLCISLSLCICVGIVYHDTFDLPRWKVLAGEFFCHIEKSAHRGPWF